MNLDDRTLWEAPSAQMVLAELSALMADLQRGWQTGLQFALPTAAAQQVLVLGRGEAGLAGEVFASLAEEGQVAVRAWRRPELAAWVQGAATWVLYLSGGGDAELADAARHAQERGCTVLCLGGERLFFWLGQLLGLASHAGWLAVDGLAEALPLLAAQQAQLLPEVAVSGNPAKRMAGQWVGRQVVMVSGDGLRPAALAWKEWCNRLAKTWAQVAWLPEMDEDGVAATCLPAVVAEHSIVVFLRGAGDTPRNRMRSDLTREVFLMEGVGTDFFVASGESRLAQLCTALQFGAFTALYLALAQGVDPAPAPVLAALNEMLDGQL